jgi:hypothetical protein
VLGSCSVKGELSGPRPNHPLAVDVNSFKPAICWRVRSPIRIRRMVPLTESPRIRIVRLEQLSQRLLGRHLRHGSKYAATAAVRRDFRKGSLQVGRRSYLSKAGGMAFPMKRILFPSRDQFGSAQEMECPWRTLRAIKQRWIRR